MTPTAGTANAAAASPRTIIDGILVDDAPVLQRRALRPAAEPNTLPRFGDDRWSLNAAIADRHTPEQSVNWPRYPAPLRHACKLYAFALLNVIDDAPRLINAHTDVPGVKTVFADLGYLHKFVSWLDGRGISEFAAITQQDLDAYYSHLAGMPGATSKWRRKCFLTVQRLHAYRAVLPEFCRLPAGPLWGGASAASLAGDPIARLRENAARRIHPDVMHVLLSAALLVSDTVAADLLPITKRLIAMRTIAHDVARLGSRPARQDGQKTRAMQEHLERLLPAYAAAGHTLPAQVSAGGEPVLDHIGFATAGWLDRQFLRKSAPARQAIAASGLPMTPNLLRVTTFADVKSRPWRSDPVDAETLRDLLRHVTTACFLVIAYLSGVRTGEALNLQRGCITRDPKLRLIFMSGQQMKATGDRRERSVRTVPWVVTEQTAHAVAVLEAISPGPLLFPGERMFSPRWLDAGGTSSRQPGVLSDDIAALIDWFNTELAPAIDHPGIPDDPNGRIVPPRLRRTLAWHIVRRPGGTIAAATQYGHVKTQIIQGYAGRANAGFLDELSFEEFLLRAETLHADYQRLRAGEHVSGSAASAYRDRVTASQRFNGLSVTSTQANQALANPDLQVHHGALLTCVYRPATAACRDPDEDGSGPSWSRCRLTCSNIARTDRDINQLRAHVDGLKTDLAAPGTPEPLRRRIQHRLDEHERAITEHETTRPARGRLEGTR